MSIPIDQRTGDAASPTELARQAAELRGLLDKLGSADDANIAEALDEREPARPERTLAPAVTERLARLALSERPVSMTDDTQSGETETTQSSLEEPFVAWAKEVALRRHLPGVDLSHLKTMQDLTDPLDSRDWSKEWKSGH
jgi:hypothetical protein